MNIETTGFALLTAVIGMGIVFSFLVFLSFVMVLLRRLFDAQPAGAPAQTRGVAARRSKLNGAAAAEPSEEDEAENTLPPWLGAAVAAFLIAEERDAARTATSWAPMAGAGADPWTLTAGGLRRNQ